MDHAEAVRDHAAEKYLLDQLSEAEQAAFEEHYFACAECAASVRAGALLEANVRAAFPGRSARKASERASQRWSLGHGWGLRFAFGLSGVAALVLAILYAHQSLSVLPRLRSELAQAGAPQALASLALRSVVRGDEQVAEVSRAARFLSLSADLAPDFSYKSYRCELADGGGKVRFALTVPAPRASGDPLHILVPVSSLETGRYVLTVRGADPEGGEAGREAGRYAFLLRRE